MPSGPDRTGVMVVRIWIDGTAGEIRARLTETLDITTADETVRTAASVDEVLTIARDWLGAFIGDAPVTSR